MFRLRVVIMCIVISLVGAGLTLAGASDTNLLMQKGYAGGFSKSDCKKKSGKITLEIYKPYIDNLTSHGLPDINKTKKLNIEYDEIWRRKSTENLTKSEIKKWRDQLDIITVYLKNSKIQACVVQKRFISNPLTGQRFSKPEYQIVSLETREEVLSHY